MRILVVGSGGREHALCWKLAQEAEVHAAPGNPGIAQCAICHDVKASDAAGLIELAKSLLVDLIVVGPEAPLIAGLGDDLRAAGFAVFGPNADGAALEGSKAFSKELMIEAGVPTAASFTTSSYEEALEKGRHLLRHGTAVVKASGPALGKGVVICGSEEELKDCLKSMMVARDFGEAGSTVVLEEFLHGREFSLLTLVSGTAYWSLPVAQDYKRIFDGDRGPNTGGMGSYSPVEWLCEDLVRQTEETVVAPMLRKLAEKGIDYRGVLFSGLMVMGNEVKCLEYNVRFGDPETQSVMPRLGRGFSGALTACANGEPIPPVEVLDNAAVTVVLASAGYPASSTPGVPIQMQETDVLVFHAGTALQNGVLVTAGGRVLGVTGDGSNVAEARKKTFDGLRAVWFEGMHFREDIGA